MTQQPPDEDENFRDDELLAAEQLRLLLDGTPTPKSNLRDESDAVATLRGASIELTRERESAIYDLLRTRLDGAGTETEEPVATVVRIFPLRARTAVALGFALAAAAVLAIFAGRSVAPSTDRVFVEAQVRFLHDGDADELRRATRQARANLLRATVLSSRTDAQKPEQLAVLERSRRKP